MKEVLSVSKKSNKSPKFRCVPSLWRLILKLQLVIWQKGQVKYISTENLFKIPERAGIDKIRLADLLKIHLCVELDPQDGNSSHKRETTSNTL